MADIAWLAQEAKSIHALFSGVFYGLVTVLLVLGVVLEYFKLPLGGMPQVSNLVGRALVAAILLQTYPEISNAIADFTDALASQIGDLNQFKLVLSRMGDKLGELTFSWTSVKDSVMLVISFVTFFILYLSVYLADAAIIYAWVILYVFSPLLIALYVLPVTAGATKTLYRSLLEVSAWKIVWSVLATLLWSAALGNINRPEANVSFITAVAFNLILAASLLMTPQVVNALAKTGIAGVASGLSGVAASAALMNPGLMAKAAGLKTAAATKKAAGAAYSGFRERYFGTPGSTPRGSKLRTPPNGRSSGDGPPSDPPPSPHSSSRTKRTTESAHSVSFSRAAAQYTPPPNRSGSRGSGIPSSPRSSSASSSAFSKK